MLDHTERPALEGLAAAAVATRPAPGPLAGPPYSTMGAHYRDPADPARCVCGVSWVQAMTCHPCRLGPHTGRDCVDGPPTVQVPHRDGTPRFYYADRGAGRWCSCQHVTPDGEPLADAWTPPTTTVGISLSSDPGLYVDDHTVTVSVRGDADAIAENLNRRFGHPAYTAELNRPRAERPAPYLAPALAEVVDGSTPAAAFLRGLRSSEIAAEMLRMDRGLLARVTERQRQALAEHARRPGRRPLAERLAERKAAGARRTEGASWAELVRGDGVRAEVEMPDGERVEARVFFGPAARRVDGEAAAARAARLIGACGGAVN